MITEPSGRSTSLLASPSATCKACSISAWSMTTLASLPNFSTEGPVRGLTVSGAGLEREATSLTVLSGESYISSKLGWSYGCSCTSDYCKRNVHRLLCTNGFDGAGCTRLFVGGWMIYAGDQRTSDANSCLSRGITSTRSTPTGRFVRPA
jgi:hypothetical protein